MSPAGWLVGAGLCGLHGAALLVAFGGPGRRFAAGVAVVAANYGLRRLLFLDPVLGAEPMAWYGVILLGDMTLALIVSMAAMHPAAGTRLTRTDLAVAALAVVATLLAVVDDRTSGLMRAAHWKDEYFYLIVYVLARLDPPLRQVSGLLAGIAGVGVAVAAWQAVMGPTPLDLAWVASGRSMLADHGGAEVVGAHGLGNLEAGWLRPYGVFGNGTDMGVFLTLLALLAAAQRLPQGRTITAGLLLRALGRPLPVLCLLGVLLTVVRFGWAVAAVAVGAVLVLGVQGAVRRTMRLAAVGLSGALVIGGFVAVAPALAGTGGLFERAFVTGTWLDRVQAQAVFLDHLTAHPGVLVSGEGFGAHGSAAAKFGPPDRPEAIAHHSRLFDFVQDGGLGLALLQALPLVLAVAARPTEPVRVVALAFVLALFACAALLGAKSALLATCSWAALAIAVTPRRDVPSCG